MSRLRRNVRVGIASMILLIGILPLLTEQLSSTSKLTCLIVAGVIGAAFATLQIFDIPVGIETKVLSWGRSLLERLAKQRGIKSKLDRYSIERSGLTLRRAIPLMLS